MALRPAVRHLLLGGIMPLWLGGGLADWCLHRRTHIQVGVPGRAESGSTAYHRGGLGSDASVWQSPEQVARDRRGLGTGSADG